MSDIPGPGHNSSVGGIDAERLKSIVSRIENLESERKGLAEDIKDLYAEAKGGGFDARVLRQIVAIRRKDPQKVAHEQELFDLYSSALGDK